MRFQPGIVAWAVARQPAEQGHGRTRGNSQGRFGRIIAALSDPVRQPEAAT